MVHVRCLTDRAWAAGDTRADARVVDDSARPPGRKHSASVRAITARQLQAHVRRQEDRCQSHYFHTSTLRTCPGGPSSNISCVEAKSRMNFGLVPRKLTYHFRYLVRRSLS